MAPLCLFFFQAEDGIRDLTVTGVQTCALPIYQPCAASPQAQCTRCDQDDNTTAENDQGPSLVVFIFREVSPDGLLLVVRSEERRVGKEGRSRLSADEQEKK